MLTGVVVSAGLAPKTVKVRVGGEEWNKKVRKVKRDHALPHLLFSSHLAGTASLGSLKLVLIVL